MEKISQMLGEIYTGHNQSLCEHVKNRPKSTNFLPLAHMELHLVKLSYAPNLYYPSPSHKCKPHYSFCSSITSYTTHQATYFCLSWLPEILSKSCIIAIKSASHITLLSLVLLSLIGYSYSLHLWHMAGKV